MKNLGTVNHIIECEAYDEQARSTTYRSQYQFTKVAIEKFLLNGENECDTHCDPAVTLSKEKSPKTLEKGER
jgi:hypothetical protein